MAKQAVAPPPIDADVPTLVDWLELSAFTDARQVGRLDDIDAAFAILQEEKPQNDGDASAEDEDRRSQIEAEINLRNETLATAYPFELTDDGEELVFKPKDRRTSISFF